MSDIVGALGWTLATLLAFVGWHNYRRWQYWSEEWAKEYRRRANRPPIPCLCVGGPLDGKRFNLSPSYSELHIPWWDKGVLAGVEVYHLASGSLVYGSPPPPTPPEAP